MIRKLLLYFQPLKSTGAGGSNPMQYLALKVQKSAEHYTKAAIDKIEFLDCIAKERVRCESLKKRISAAPRAITPPSGGGACPRAER